MGNNWLVCYDFIIKIRKNKEKCTNKSPQKPCEHENHGIFVKFWFCL